MMLPAGMSAAGACEPNHTLDDAEEAALFCTPTMVTIGAGSRGAAAAVGTPASATLTTMPPAREVWTALRTSGPLKKSAVIRTRRTTLAPAATRSAAVATSCRHRLRTSHAQISQPRL